MGGLYLAVFTGFSPQLQAMGLINMQMRETVITAFPIVALVSGLTSMVVLILSGVADVLFSRNKPGWKAKWTAIILVFQLIGLVAYYMIGSKDRVEEHALGRKRK
jgi:uncharacterized membrane protein YeiH